MKVRWLVAFLLAAFTGVAAAQQGQVPTTETALGSVRIPRAVKADGKDLKAGTYQVRLTAQDASPTVPGIKMERWVEFVQGGKVAGREVVSIVPGSEVKDLQPGPDAPPSTRAGSKVEMLKGNDYLRVWISRAGVIYLIHMPPA
ncbi:MAG TPA: hypothetical protein VL914_01160 [Vicinamibacterales bacterium]|jgi:hypothetical protein|nr:hypothetical protein [Vicinamibacterales bacterium]HTH25220.1 hypothetical protein [Vicinamibacterales bacterium]